MGDFIQQAIANTAMSARYTTTEGKFIPGPSRFGEASRLPAGAYTIERVGPVYGFSPSIPKTDRLERPPNSTAETVIGAIEQFWKMRSGFDRYGFAFKRGILLYGPPGTGKTSIISVIGRRVVENDGIVIVLAESIALLRHMLRGLRDQEPYRPVLVVLEDIEEHVENDENGLTALLDGEASIDGVCYLATTNHIDALPDKIRKRPSRFDLVIEVGPPALDVRRAYLASKRVPPDKALEIAEASDGMSFAHLKELIVGHLIFGNELKGEVERVRGMMPEEGKDDKD